MPATPPPSGFDPYGADRYGSLPPGGYDGGTTASGGDGVTAGIGALAIVGLLVAIVVLWLTRCDVSVLEQLVDTFQDAAS
jgi:hypothetical protein